MLRLLAGTGFHESHLVRFKIPPADLLVPDLFTGVLLQDIFHHACHGGRAEVILQGILFVQPDILGLLPIFLGLHDAGALPHLAFNGFRVPFPLSKL